VVDYAGIPSVFRMDGAMARGLSTGQKATIWYGAGPWRVRLPKSSHVRDLVVTVGPNGDSSGTFEVADATAGQGTTERRLQMAGAWPQFSLAKSSAQFCPSDLSRCPLTTSKCAGTGFECSLTTNNSGMPHPRDDIPVDGIVSFVPGVQVPAQDLMFNGIPAWAAN